MSGPILRFFRGFFPLLLLCSLAAGCVSTRERGADWTPGLWRGEKAWIAEHAGWRAVVSQARARLVHLGPADTGANLLHEPARPEDFRPRGGHIFWLGPQAEWNGRWGAWPPPAEWEQQAALRARDDGPWLHLDLPRPDAARPALRRSYRWRDGALLCRTAWSGGAGDHQAIQILQLSSSAVVEVRGSGGAPDFVGFGTDGHQTLLPPAPADGLHLDDETVRVESRVSPAKYGFRPAALRAVVNDCLLVMERGAIEGEALDSPDQGFETQVYVGGEKFPFVEIEQLTPRLKNRGAAENAFTVRLLLDRPATPRPFRH